MVLLLGLINMMRGGSPNTLAEADAAARAAAVRRDRHHHGRDLGDGPLKGSMPWSFSTASTPAPATTARRRSARGERRKKYDLRVAAYGTVDETNAAIGVVRLHLADAPELDRHARAHPERSVRSRRRSRGAPARGQGGAAARAGEPGRAAGARHRHAQCRAGAADLVRSARRHAGRRLSASRAHHLPPGGTR